ncbi:hypothetical protein LTEGF4_25720 (plasmid) [Limnohabitans sp. TEGF004]|nr:hypothetical protein LTEGF4_25720 [Limnohabitans sp. TEGF004]
MGDAIYLLLQLFVSPREWAEGTLSVKCGQFSVSGNNMTINEFVGDIELFGVLNLWTIKDK